MRRFFPAIILIFGLCGVLSFGSPPVFAKKSKPGVSRQADEGVSDTTNVHYDRKYCSECHVRTPSRKDNALKYEGNFQKLCRCHYQGARRDIHPVDLEPSEKMRPRIPDTFPLQDGKIACITCHDVYDQCQPEKLNEGYPGKPMFLRKSSDPKHKDFCFQCHDAFKFEKYNPHKQLNKNGVIDELKCLYCHAEVPDVTKSEFDDIKLIGNLDMLCDRCHNKMGEQSLHARHVRRPSPKVYASIKQLEVQHGIVLPLNENGGITCATCHNPHQKGVIPDKREGAKGADEKKRHRLSGNICIKCHQM